jgi:hypothetical protein
VCALAELESRLTGLSSRHYLGVATRKVVIAPNGYSSNKVATTLLSGSKLLGKNASIIAELPCVRQKNKTTPSAPTLGVVEVSPHMSALLELGKNRTDGSNSLGAEVGIAATLPCLWQERKYPELNDSGCSRGSSLREPIQQAGYKLVERIDLLG